MEKDRKKILQIDMVNDIYEVTVNPGKRNDVTAIELLGAICNACEATLNALKNSGYEESFAKLRIMHAALVGIGAKVPQEGETDESGHAVTDAGGIDN